MKRSEINRLLREALRFCEQQNFHLPQWARWSPDAWSRVGPEADEIRRRLLGWDVTDFGRGDFERFGLVLFTIRNGEPSDGPDALVKDYCEKLLIVAEGQVTPTHFHWSKMEDIINRSGGRLVLQLWQADRTSEALDERSPVRVSIDGIEREVPPGGEVVLDPGESITLAPYMYHNFYAEPGSGKVLAGEVSRVNDDANDNRFVEPLGRFPQIEEDEPAELLLCNEYPPSTN
jgi:hypothetical protein